MRKNNAWLIGILLIVLGCVVFALVMGAVGFDFGALAGVPCTENTYEITESFTGIYIEESTSDIRILPSEDGVCRVKFTEREKELHTAAVSDGVLKILFSDTRTWIEKVSLFSKPTKIELYLPMATYASLTVRASTGDVTVDEALAFEKIDLRLSTGDVTSAASVTGEERISVSTGDVKIKNATLGALSVETSTGRVSLESVVCEGNVSIEVDSGDVSVTDTVCKSFFTEGDTGDLNLKNVIAEQAFEIERDTGDVSFEACDAASLSIETSTGDVEGTLLSDKSFTVETDTGRVRVPRGTTGGACMIETDTGDIEIEIVKE